MGRRKQYRARPCERSDGAAGFLERDTTDAEVARLLRASPRWAGALVAVATASAILSACGTSHRATPGGTTSSPSSATATSAIAGHGLSSVPGGTTTTTGGVGPSTSAPRWLIAAGALNEIAADPGVRAVLDRPTTFVIVRNAAAEVPAGWGVTAVLSFRSYADLHAALSGGQSYPGIGGVLYDPERWSFTPLQEQQDPAQYVALAAADAHQRGWTFIATPGTDLVSGGSSAGPSRYQRFLDSGILGAAAKSADIVDIQAQGSATDTSEFADVVRQGAAQIRAARPATLVLAGLSTNPPGAEVTLDELRGAVDASRSLVDGYWLNIPSPGAACPTCNPSRPDLAVALLDGLA